MEIIINREERAENGVTDQDKGLEYPQAEGSTRRGAREGPRPTTMV